MTVNSDLSRGPRQIALSMPGGLPLGFRLSPMPQDSSLFSVAKIRAHSKADKSGLQLGDVVLAINHISCQTLSHLAVTALTDTSDILHLLLLRNMSQPSEAKEAFKSLESSLRKLNDKELTDLTANPNLIVARRQSTGCIQPMVSKDNKHPPLKLFGNHKFIQSNLIKISPSNEKPPISLLTKANSEERQLEKQNESGTDSKTIPRRRERLRKQENSTERRHFVPNRFKNIAMATGITDKDLVEEEELRREMNLLQFENFSSADHSSPLSFPSSRDSRSQSEESKFKTKMEVSLGKEEVPTVASGDVEVKQGGVTVRRFSLTTPNQQVIQQKSNTVTMPIFQISPLSSSTCSPNNHTSGYHSDSESLFKNKSRQTINFKSSGVKSYFPVEEPNTSSSHDNKQTQQEKTKNQITSIASPRRSQINITSSKPKVIQKTRLRSNSLGVVSSIRSSSHIQQMPRNLAPQPISINTGRHKPDPVSSSNLVSSTLQNQKVFSKNQQGQFSNTQASFQFQNSIKNSTSFYQFQPLATSSHQSTGQQYQMQPPRILSRKLSMPEQKTLEKSKQNIVLSTKRSNNLEPSPPSCSPTNLTQINKTFEQTHYTSNPSSSWQNDSNPEKISQDNKVDNQKINTFPYNSYQNFQNYSTQEFEPSYKPLQQQTEMISSPQQQNFISAETQQKIYYQHPPQQHLQTNFAPSNYTPQYPSYPNQSYPSTPSNNTDPYNFYHNNQSNYESYLPAPSLPKPFYGSQLSNPYPTNSFNSYNPQANYSNLANINNYRSNFGHPNSNYQQFSSDLNNSYFLCDSSYSNQIKYLDNNFTTIQPRPYSSASSHSNSVLSYNKISPTSIPHQNVVLHRQTSLDRTIGQGGRTFDLINKFSNYQNHSQFSSYPLPGQKYYQPPVQVQPLNPINNSYSSQKHSPYHGNLSSPMSPSSSSYSYSSYSSYNPYNFQPYS